MNPLKLPWATKAQPKVELELEGERVDPPYQGLRKSRAPVTASYLTVEVRGVRAVPSGPYRVEYSEGAPLRHYMRQLRLLHAASYSAVYDRQYPDKGRLRLTYRPHKDSRIAIVPANTGTATKMQRSRQNVDRLVSKMAEDKEVVLGHSPSKSDVPVKNFGPPKLR